MGGVIGIILSYMISFAMNTFGFSMSGLGICRPIMAPMYPLSRRGW